MPRRHLFGVCVVGAASDLTEHAVISILAVFANVRPLPAAHAGQRVARASAEALMQLGSVYVDQAHPDLRAIDEHGDRVAVMHVDHAAIEICPC